MSDYKASNLRIGDLPLGLERERDRVSVVGQRLGLRRIGVELKHERIHRYRDSLVPENLDRRLLLSGGALADPFVGI